MSQLLALVGILLACAPARSQTLSSLPTGTVTSTDTAGDVYAAWPWSLAGGDYSVGVGMYPAGSTLPKWTRFFSLGPLSMPGGIGVDAGGTAYVSATDFSLERTAIYKYDLSGVLVSTRAGTYPASESPLAGAVAVDAGRGAVYAVTTFADPARAGATDAAIQAYDSNLNLVMTQTLSDAAGVSDEGAWVTVVGTGDVLMGIAQWAVAGSTSPSSYQVASFSPWIERLVSRTASGPFDPFFPVWVYYVSGSGQTAAVGTSFALPLVAQELDSGVPVTGCYVEFLVVSGPAGATFSPALALIDKNGNASTVMTAGAQPGVYTVQAQASRYLCASFGRSYATFIETATAAQLPQDFVSISTGDAQIGVVGSSVTTPLTALVQSAPGSPAANVAVGFAVSSAPVNATGQGVLPASAGTGSNGLASTVLTLGNVPADYYVTATAAGTASSATFHACGKLGAPDFSQGDPRWGQDVYGITVSSRIHALGCALTSLADINDFYTAVSTTIPMTDPGALNSYLIKLGTAGYVGGTVVNWSGIQSFTGRHIQYVAAGSGDVDNINTQKTLLATADDDLLNRRPVMFRVLHPKSHFMAVIGKCGLSYIVSDPGDKNRVLYNPNDPADPYQFLGIRRFRAH